MNFIQSSGIITNYTLDTNLTINIYTSIFLSWLPPLCKGVGMLEWLGGRLGSIWCWDVGVTGWSLRFYLMLGGWSDWVGAEILSDVGRLEWRGERWGSIWCWEVRVAGWALRSYLMLGGCSDWVGAEVLYDVGRLEWLVGTEVLSDVGRLEWLGGRGSSIWCWSGWVGAEVLSDVGRLEWLGGRWGSIWCWEVGVAGWALRFYLIVTILLGCISMCLT